MIICCGEALIDMLPRETAGGEPAFAPYAGGAVFNTAIALGRLGVETGFFSGLSTDIFGEMLVRALETSKVDASRAARSDRPTTLAFVTLNDGQASYAFYDENTAGRMLAPSDLPDLHDDGAAMFFGGISLMVEPCGQTYESLMLREAGKRVTMLDPNIRADFIKDPARFRARIGRMIAAADIVKISDEDLAWLGMDIDALLSTKTALVCLTEGADGVVAYWDGGSVRVPAEQVDVVDTVGAGDTFNAGLLAGLEKAGVLTREGLRGLDEATVRPAVELGNRAAAVTVSRAGANPPWAGELA
jgi:fructokinase